MELSVQVISIGNT